MPHSEEIAEMNGILHEMKPMLAFVVKSIDSVENRLRNIEVKSAGYDVQLPRLIADVDKLGSKLRAHVDRDCLRDPATDTKWMAVLEFLAVAPKYWHVILTIGTIAATVIVEMWRHR